MIVTNNMRICSAALIVMALVSFFVLRNGETIEASAKPAGAFRAFIEERVEADAVNCRVSAPVIVGLGAEADLAANRALRVALGVDDALGFIAERRAAGQSDWDARFRFKAWTCGGVFRVQSVMTLYENGNMPLETRKEVYFDRATGVFYSLGDLFKPESLTGAMKSIGEYIKNIIQENPGGYLDGASPLPLPENLFFDGGVLTMYYQPGEIAPYSDGFKEFRVSLEVYEAYLDKDGAFYKAITQNNFNEGIDIIHN